MRYKLADMSYKVYTIILLILILFSYNCEVIAHNSTLRHATASLSRNSEKIKSHSTCNCEKKVRIVK